jgi:hypothetical protein
MHVPFQGIDAHVYTELIGEARMCISAEIKLIKAD